MNYKVNKNIIINSSRKQVKSNEMISIRNYK